eukprot:1138640-Pelagomonas_calceolata.AAC.6
MAFSEGTVYFSDYGNLELKQMDASDYTVSNTVSSNDEDEDDVRDRGDQGRWRGNRGRRRILQSGGRWYKSDGNGAPQGIVALPDGSLLVADSVKAHQERKKVSEAGQKYVQA